MSSRFTYDTFGDDEPNLSEGRWIARVKAVMKGKPGKRSFGQLVRALLTLPQKRLIAGSLCDGTGVCAIGALGYRHYVDQGMTPQSAWKKMRGAARCGDFSDGPGIDEFGRDELGLTETLAWLIAEKNDEQWGHETPEYRYRVMLDWARRHAEVKDA